MTEFIAKNSRQLSLYCKIFLSERIEYSIEHFEIKPGKVAFRLITDVTEEKAGQLQRMFNNLYL